MRLLTVMGRLPYPADTGGKIRSSKLFERLAKRHDITIVSFRTPQDSDEQVRMTSACCSRLVTVDWEEIPKRGAAFYASVARSVVSTRAYTVAKYADARVRQTVVQLLQTEPYDALVCDFLQPSVNVLDVTSVPQDSVPAQRRVGHPSPADRADAKSAGQSLSVLGLAKAAGVRATRRRSGSITASWSRAEDCRTMAREFGVTTTSAIPTAVDVEYFVTASGRDDQRHRVHRLDGLVRERGRRAALRAGDSAARAAARGRDVLDRRAATRPTPSGASSRASRACG